MNFIEYIDNECLIAFMSYIYTIYILYIVYRLYLKYVRNTCALSINVGTVMN